MKLEDISLNELEQFKQNPIWQVMVQTIKDRIEMIRTDLELGYSLHKHQEAGSTKRFDFEEIRDLQKEALSLRYTMNLPDIYIELLTKPEESKNG